MKAMPFFLVFMVMSSSVYAESAINCSAQIKNSNGGDAYSENIALKVGTDDEILGADFDWKVLTDLMGSYQIALSKNVRGDASQKYVLSVRQVKVAQETNYQFPAKRVNSKVKFGSLPAPITFEVSLGTYGSAGGGNSGTLQITCSEQ